MPRSMPSLPMNPTVGRSSGGKRNIDIIKDILKPVKIEKDPNAIKEVKIAYDARHEAHTLFKEKKITGVKRTNMPYKIILRDHVVSKAVDDVVEGDLVVHRFVDGVDNNRRVFRRELRTVLKEGKKVDEELEMEYCPENREKHKTKFEYRQTFMKNMVYEAKTHEEGKKDFIEFYAQKQKEMEQQLHDCDRLIRELEDTGVLDASEMPVGDSAPAPDARGVDDALAALGSMEDDSGIEDQPLTRSLDEHVKQPRSKRDLEGITKKKSAEERELARLEKQARRDERELRRHRRELQRIEKENRELARMK